MKITAVLVALAAAIAAPLAAAQCIAANQALLDKLTITSTIKKTAVNGGARIVQSIIVKNANAAPVLVGMGTGYDDAKTL